MSDTDVNGQGVVFSLYHYLWLYDYMTKVQPSIRIPHTVQYILGEAKFWYFSSRDGKILRKNKVKTVPDEIYSAFTRHIPACGFNREQENQFVYNYMDQDEFKRFIFDQDFYRHGILQQFIQPKGDHNFVIKSTWSKQVCLFETYRNNFQINDTKADVFQRVSTFESIRSPCQIEALKGNVLPLTIESKCNSIALHVFNVTQERVKIKSMSCYWKQDVKEQLYLILCSDVSSFSEKQDQSSSYAFRLPEHIDEARLSYPLPINLKKLVVCCRCEALFSDKQTFTYRGKLPNTSHIEQNKVQLKQEQIFMYDSTNRPMQSPNQRKMDKPVSSAMCKDCYLSILKPKDQVIQGQPVKQPARLIERNLLGSIRKLERSIASDRQLSTEERSLSTTREERSLYYQEHIHEAKRLNRMLTSLNNSVERPLRRTSRTKLLHPIETDLYGLKVTNV